MSKDFDSENLRYAMPEGLAGVLASSGFAEAARAFKAFDGEQVPHAVRANLSLVAEQRVVTQDDIEREVKALIDRAGGNATSPAVQQAISEMQMMVGQPYANLSAYLMGRFEDLTNKAQGYVADMNDVETATQRNARLRHYYENDAEYRAKTDKIAAAADAANEKLAADTQAMDEELKAKGIVAAQDEAIAELQEKMKTAQPWEKAAILKQIQALKEEKFEQNRDHLSPTTKSQTEHDLKQSGKEADALVAQQKEAEEQAKLAAHAPSATADHRASTESVRDEILVKQAEKQQEKHTGFFAYSEASAAESFAPKLAGDASRAPGPVAQL